MKLERLRGLRCDRRRRKRAGGFTLVELLVVVAIIAVLAGLLLPALAGAKGKSQAITCLNNIRQIELACLIYTDEFNDRLPYNLGENEIRALRRQRQFLNWSTPIMDWERSTDNTNTALLTEGGIGPYASRSARIYKCPKDNYVSDIQSGLGWPARVRSFSMNAMVGDAGTFSRSGANVNNPRYRQFFKSMQIPKPQQIFTFIEEHPNSLGDGYFLNQPDTPQWLRLPASHHSGAVELTYSDGHAETYRWKFPATRQKVRPGAAYLPVVVASDARGDFDWLMYRTSTESWPELDGQ